MNDVYKQEKQLLADWLKRINVSQTTHYETAKSYSKKNLQFGIPTVALSALVGTAVFSALGENVVNVYLQIIVGFLSIFAAVLASLQTFLRFSQKAEEHRIAGAKFGAVKRAIEEALDIETGSPQEIKQRISSIKHTLDELAEGSPPTPEWAYKKATDLISKPDRA